MTIIEALTSGTNSKDLYHKKDSHNNFDAKKADHDLKACPCCGLVWEIAVSNNTIEHKYYGNFPTFGKVKSVCPGCKIRIKNKYYRNSEVVDPI